MRLLVLLPLPSFFFFFNDTAPTEIYTLSLHDALPILVTATLVALDTGVWHDRTARPPRCTVHAPQDRKSTRLNSSHSQISYAVFCLKKKKKKKTKQQDLQTNSRSPMECTHRSLR